MAQYARARLDVAVCSKRSQQRVHVPFARDVEDDTSLNNPAESELEYYAGTRSPSQDFDFKDDYATSDRVLAARETERSETESSTRAQYATSTD